MRRPAVGRTTAVAGTVGLGGLLLGVAAAPWLEVTVRTALTTATIAVRGSDAVPAVPAAALVLLAGGLALALAGAVARLVASVAVSAVGVVVVAVTAGFLADPSSAAVSAVAEVTGVRGLEGEVATTPWPAVALGLGVVAALGGVVLAVAQRAWERGTRGRRYERSGPPGGGVPTEPRVRAMDDWDALSRGEDPS